VGHGVNPGQEHIGLVPVAKIKARVLVVALLAKSCHSMAKTKLDKFFQDDNGVAVQEAFHQPINVPAPVRHVNRAKNLLHFIRVVSGKSEEHLVAKGHGKTRYMVTNMYIRRAKSSKR